MGNNKLIFKEEIISFFTWGKETPIFRIREYLDEIEKLGATHIDVEAEGFQSDAWINVQPYKEIIETDEEYERRMELEADRMELNRLKEIEKLKQKLKELENGK